jgi:hypothetical protein
MTTQNKYYLVAMLFLCLPSISIASNNTSTPEDELLFSSNYTDENAIFPLKVLLSNSNKTILKNENPNGTIYWKLLPEYLGGRDVSKGSCYSDTASQPYTVKDLLAVPLSGLVYGKNRIVGQCFGKEHKECYVEITHASGEDVYSYQIRFKTNFDKMIMDSLWCRITP